MKISFITIISALFLSLGLVILSNPIVAQAQDGITIESSSTKIGINETVTIKVTTDFVYTKANKEVSFKVSSLNNFGQVNPATCNLTFPFIGAGDCSVQFTSAAEGGYEIEATVVATSVKSNRLNVAVLPACIRDISRITTDPNAYNAEVSGYGTLTFYISNKRLIVASNSRRGSWSCNGNQLSIILDKLTTPTPTPTTTPTNTNIGTSSNSTSGGFKLSVKINNPLKVDTVQDAIKLFMDAVLRIALPFIIVFFIWAGLSFVLARGNPEGIKKAKNMFWYTLIGTLLILGAWTITNAIIGTVNSITG